MEGWALGQQKTQKAAHGYTKSMEDTTVLRVTPSRYIDTKDHAETEIWPKGLPSEVIMHRGP